jgi:hypothetical protein
MAATTSSALEVTLLLFGFRRQEPYGDLSCAFAAVLQCVHCHCRKQGHKAAAERPGGRTFASSEN